jgi:hypothetical protein
MNLESAIRESRRLDPMPADSFSAAVKARREQIVEKVIAAERDLANAFDAYAEAVSVEEKDNADAIIDRLYAEEVERDERLARDRARWGWDGEFA